jgi:hypothetical protein
MNSMTHRKSILGFGGTITAIVLIGMAIATPSAQAQTADSSQQIRDYLIKAIKALDDGNNPEAIRQLQLATDQMSTSFTTISEQPNGDGSAAGRGGNSDSSGSGSAGENDDEGEGSEEGEGEDADEPGDVDTNDEED